MRNNKYFLSLLPGATVIFGNVMGGWWALSNIVFFLGILALLEWFVPEDKSNEYEKSYVIPDFILVLHVAMQVAVLSTLFFAIYNHRFTTIQLVAAGFSTGIQSGSSSIVIAHEMIHRKEKIWQGLGKFLLFTAGNIYFYIEHLRVHHKYVGLDLDPATARYNESLYRFYLRSSVSQIAGAWKLETERMRKEGRNIFNPSNYIVGSLSLLILLLAALWFFIGFVAVLMFIGQSVVANFLLEYTNYIEHYGLSRVSGDKVDETISWQSDKVISRFFLVDLSRHSDHHYYSSKPYHKLLSYEKSPVLPGGYASAFYLALIPPLWFHVMNKRIATYHAFLQS